MRIEPATVDQIRRGHDGRMVLIDADVGGVAKDLKAIDPHLKVRFAEAANPPCWVVFWESDDNRSTYLVTSCQAHQTQSGTWAGLDQRLVERIKSIDPANGYDYAAELEKHNRLADQRRREAFEAKTAPLAEQAAHAIRKDLGDKSRAFIK